jgi:hypothetical protein
MISGTSKHALVSFVSFVSFVGLCVMRGRVVYAVDTRSR